MISKAMRLHCKTASTRRISLAKRTNKCQNTSSSCSHSDKPTSKKLLTKCGVILLLATIVICISNYKNLQQVIKRKKLYQYFSFSDKKPNAVATINDAGNLTTRNLEKAFFSHPLDFLRSKSSRRVSTEVMTCKKRENIAFIKTHKTAGTVVQNILFRYGLNHQLRFALPRNKHDFYYPQWFTKKMVVKFGFEPFNIICQHMRFHYKRVRELMPPGTIFVSIVREPGALFESTFTYFWSEVAAFRRVPQKQPNACEKWLDHASKYIKTEMDMSNYTDMIDTKHFAKNPTFFDLGYEYSTNNKRYIKNSIQQLDKIFDLVLVADYFPESMVLLADLLCWNLSDVAYFNLNARTKKGHGLSPAEHARIRRKARQWNSADAALFDHFNKTLWKKIEQFGVQKMRDRVQRLLKINNDLLRNCVEGAKSVDIEQVKDRELRKAYHPPEVSVQGYNLKANSVNNSTCRRIIMDENAFGTLIYSNHKLKFPIPDYIENMA